MKSYDQALFGYFYMRVLALLVFLQKQILYVVHDVNLDGMRNLDFDIGEVNSEVAHENVDRISVIS